MFSEQNLRQIGIFAVCGLILSALVLGPSVFASGDQDRPRTTQSTPAATPTPPPVPARPASTATPTPTPQTQRPTTDRIAPTLGEPPPPPRLKPTPTPTPPPVIEEGDILRINAELVQLHVRVIDRNNRPINNVPQSEFKVFEDGVPQKIESFTREEVPISYGLAVDTSGSLRSQLQSVVDAGKTIINANKPGDETFLVRFISSDKIETVQDFTDNKEMLMDGLDSFYVEGGQTAIIDAVYLSAEHVTEYKKGDEGDRRRRALIVITDGEDRNSFYKQEQLFARLREEDVQIFVIGFVNELDKETGLIRKSPRERAVNLINKLASETGGRAFFPDSVADLPQIANEIIRDLRTQYVIAYNPTNKAQDGSYRAIKVTVDQPSNSEKRIALTRTGRLARKERGQGNVRPPAVRMPSLSKP
ncbi:MAG TPA: VWA domain-containing protein [Pyrinomonadaceae bacterium]|nr:VWA domain-containing protein [Pyrinomonadaceae bacterium]